MRWKQGGKEVGQAVFVAHSRNDGIRHNIQDLYCVNKQLRGSLRFVHGAGALTGLAGMICGFGGRTGC